MCRFAMYVYVGLVFLGALYNSTGTLEFNVATTAAIVSAFIFSSLFLACGGGKYGWLVALMRMDPSPESE